MNRPTMLLLVAALLVPSGMAQNKYVDDVLALNPLGYWRLNGNTSDATGQGNNGTLINGLNFTGPGLGPPIGDLTNQAATFNAAQDQYISMPTTASNQLFALDWYHPLTMMIWAKTGNTSNSMILFAKEANSGNYTGPYLVIDNGPGGVAPQGSGHFAFLLQATPSAAGGVGGNFLGAEATVSVNDGNWHLLVATYDGDGHVSGVHLYVDGVAVSSTVFGNGDSLDGLTILNNVPVTIGARDTGGVPYAGLLAEAAIFGTVLTAAQVGQLQNDARTSAVTGVIPHFAAGDSFVTDFYIVNSSNQPENFSISFYDDSGRPVLVPLGSNTLATLEGTIAAYSTNFYEAGTSQGALVAGSAVISSGPAITVQTLFRRHGSDGSYYEAAVPASNGNHEFEIPFDATTLAENGAQLYTGIAIANMDSAITANVVCNARNSQGNLIPNAVVVPALNPLGHWANYLFPALTGLRGTLDCSSNTKIGSMGLRALGANAISSLPVIPIR
jgi:hypothetical protein